MTSWGQGTKSLSFSGARASTGCVAPLLHLAGLFLPRDLWMDELDADSFRARIARIPPQFKPRRLSAVP